MLHMLVLVLTMFDPQAPQYAEAILRHSQAAKLDPLLTAATIWRESGFINRSCHRGSHGLMAIQLRGRSCQTTLAEAERQRLYDPDENIRRGVKIMANFRDWCRQRGHRHHWLLHYNSGYGACPADKPKCVASERTVPTTGRASKYADKVLATYRQLQRLKARVERRGPVG